MTPITDSSLDERLRKAGIRHFDVLIHDQPKEWLIKNFSQGGVIISLTSQYGYELNGLPGSPSGYGWSEDQSCHTNAAYIDTYHLIFAGQDSANLDASVDGYFTQWPSEATVLLRRTKNQMPAMVKYGYDQGEVVVLTFFTDWNYGHGGWTQDEINLIRDLISWAKNPEKEIEEYKPGETVNINIPVSNHTDSPSNSVLLTLLGPNRNTISTTMVVHSLNPGESTEIPFTCTASLPLGIWWVNYSLQDWTGNTIQQETEGERFQVSYHYVGGKIDEGYKIWAVQADASLGVYMVPLSRSGGEWGVHEQYKYGRWYFYFENGILTSWQEVE